MGVPIWNVTCMSDCQHTVSISCIPETGATTSELEYLHPRWYGYH